MRLFKSLVLSLAIVAGVSACATITSPTGRTQYVGAVSQQELNQMGARSFAQLKAQKRQVGGAQAAAVRCVTSAIVGALPAQWRQLRWESALFADDNVNAFALPGGKVGVYTGIFKVARNPDQLAAVIAHEIGHVVSHHHNERITRKMGAQAGLGILGALAGDSLPAGGRLAAFGTQTFFILPNSRDQEEEADVVGQQLMARAGFDPRQAVALWQNMLREGGGRPPEMLSTHPDPQSRIGALRQRAAGLMPEYQQARAAGRTPGCG